MVTSPQVSWLFFKARAKRPYLSHTGRASDAEKQPTGRGPEGCVENGPAAALLVGYVSIKICALLAPCRRPILIATKATLFMGQDTRLLSNLAGPWIQMKDASRWARLGNLSTRPITDSRRTEPCEASEKDPEPRPTKGICLLLPNANIRLG